jgi:hypothetical protein
MTASYTIKEAIQDFVNGTHGLDNIMGSIYSEAERLIDHLYPDDNMSREIYEENLQDACNKLTHPASYHNDSVLRAAAAFIGRFIEADRAFLQEKGTLYLASSSSFSSWNFPEINIGSDGNSCVSIQARSYAPVAIAPDPLTELRQQLTQIEALAAHYNSTIGVALGHSS